MIEIYLILIIKIMNIPKKMWKEQRKAMLKLASYEARASSPLNGLKRTALNV